MTIFTEEQKSQLRERGISEQEAHRQLALLASPPVYLELVRACAAGDGVTAVPEDEQEALILEHETAAAQGRFTKFVPASGAASRMFQDLLAGRNVPAFVEALDRFAFFDDLREVLAARGEDLEQLRRAGRATEILDAVIGASGLGYGVIPKALIPFHRGPGGPRTAFEAHLAEAAVTVRDTLGGCRVHFTVPADALGAFHALTERLRPVYERRFHLRLRVEFSTQRPSTDVLAATPSGEVFTEAQGGLVFRPSGHGALLTNLAELGADLVLIKNIDNLQPEERRADTIRWKKILGGTLVTLARETHLYVARLRGTAVDASRVDEAASFARMQFGIPVPDRNAPLEQRRVALLAALDRPLRVCGVVRNTGEPGGAPFWARARGGRVSGQIVERAQIDPASAEQVAIFESAGYFNPVDLACAMKDAAGRPFDLAAFVDPYTSIVSRKSHGGRELVAFERPGLWNGAMAGWLTRFVEVPISTFTPVKSVDDLLRPEHQTGAS